MSILATQPEERLNRVSTWVSIDEHTDEKKMFTTNDGYFLWRIFFADGHPASGPNDDVVVGDDVEPAADVVDAKH